MLLAAISTYATARVAWGASLTEIEALTKLASGFGAVVAAVPMGFLLYQIYYVTYTPVLLRRKYVTRDRGATILRELPPDQLARLRTLLDARLDVRPADRPTASRIPRLLRLLELDERALQTRYRQPEVPHLAGDEWEHDERSLRRIYSDNWHENWEAVRSLLDLLHAHGGGDELKREFVSLSDIYHSLGASRLGVILGWIAAVLYLPVAHMSQVADHPWKSGLVVIGSGSMAVATFLVLHLTRQSTWRTAVGSVKFGLRWCLANSPQDLLPAASPIRPMIDRRA